MLFVLRWRRALWWTCGVLCAVALGAAAARGVGAATAGGGAEPGGAGPSGVIWRVPTDSPDVALTFDDGPDPTFTPQILGLLEEAHAEATFFVLGSQVSLYPGIARREASDGFQVCNHGWSHRMLRGVSAAVVEQDVVRTRALLQQIQVPACNLFRFPYFASDATARDVVTRLGYRIVAANVDSLDWRARRPQTMAARVLAAVRPGDIILLHDAGGPRGRTVAAVALILAGLRDRHLQAVTVQELLQAAAPPA